MEVVKIQGLSELRDALNKKIPFEMQGKTLQAALAQGSKPILDEARNLAAVKTGVLRRAIYAFRDKAGSKPTFESRFIGVKSGKKYQKGNKDAFYWRWIEFGRGAIEAKKGKTLGNEEDGWFGKSVKAAPAKPFLRPAFETRKSAALEAIKTGLADAIEKAAQKASWGKTFRDQL